MFGVQLYKNNARALLSRILSILNLDWLQHARSVRGVYECLLIGSIGIIFGSILVLVFVILAQPLEIELVITFWDSFNL